MRTLRRTRSHRLGVLDGARRSCSGEQDKWPRRARASRLPVEGGPVPGPAGPPYPADGIGDLVAHLEERVWAHQQYEGEGNPIARVDGVPRAIEMALVRELAIGQTSGQHGHGLGGMWQPGRLQRGAWCSTSVTCTTVGGTPTRQTSPAFSCSGGGPFERARPPPQARGSRRFSRRGRRPRSSARTRSRCRYPATAIALTRDTLHDPGNREGASNRQHVTDPEVPLINHSIRAVGFLRRLTRAYQPRGPLGFAVHHRAHGPTSTCSRALSAAARARRRAAVLVQEWTAGVSPTPSSRAYARVPSGAVDTAVASHWRARSPRRCAVAYDVRARSSSMSSRMRKAFRDAGSGRSAL
ncbi:hypothetical protein SUDANB180_07498 [Streptomyces sp. enrichment culture]